ncbi:hypothetical protein EAO71_35135 [Streptomyces sp. ms191]|uniref:hypothetical protein n=1 Tax=Streptomyces sp. ms191 TaxID=1827978 RepID=UPI0011CD3BF7|nr:hypothetical protein [Streptomyces sp. ms191]TXS16062.1 hypothetical protein EAO71_35135 [Streptomyces sp. ms191]
MTDHTADAPRIDTSPDGDGVILHLPEITYLDTQTWAVDIGLTPAGLAALRALLHDDDAARQVSTQQPDAEETQQCPAAEFEDYGQQCQKAIGHELHTFEQTAADYTCGSTGPAFVPAGHYRDCPQYAAVGQQDATQPTTDETEQLVHVGWWCWRGNDHGHLADMACRSDNVPIHVPTEWAAEMRAVIEHLTDNHEPGEDCTWVTPEEQAAETRAAADEETAR